MKKLLLTTLALASCAGASAQSSATLFGIVDTGVQYGSGSLSSRTSVQGVGGNLASRLGVRGTEDLGDGLQAGFWLEAGVNTDSGSGAATSTNNQPSAAGAGGGGLTFNRRSTVSLMGRWGEVRLGRDFTPTFWNHAFDPFTLLGVGAALEYTAGLRVNGPTDGTLARASNSIGYFLPDSLGGFYGQAMYAMGENPSNAANSGDGKYVGLRLGYASGPLNVAIAHGRTSQTVTKSAGGSYTDTNLGAAYNFGVMRLIGIYDVQRQERATGLGSADRRSQGWMLAATAPMGSGMFKVSYGASKLDDPSAASVNGNKATQLAVGYVYDFSKRTAVYLTVSHVRNTGGSRFALGGSTTGVDQGSSGMDLGIRHSF